MKYRVSMTVDATLTVEVEAENEEQAKELAWDIAEAPCLCHHCSDQVDVGDLMEVCSVDAVS
ncbi:MAG: hypothetical protein ACXU8A_00185 [Burkholderiaceae bacterium]